MKLLDKLLGRDSESKTYDGPCNETGHAFEDGDRTHYGYFTKTRGFSSRNSTKFKVYEKYWYECPKCGQTDHKRKTIGTFKVESGELKDMVNK